MKTGLLLLSVCILTTVCAFAQNEQKRPFERENHRERAPQSTFFSFRENENPEIRRGRTPIATLQSATATHRLDSVVGRVEIWPGMEMKFKQTFEIEYNGNEIVAIGYRWEGNEWIESWKEKFVFDDNGNLTMQASYYLEDDAWTGSWKERFAFDYNGNRIMRAEYNWDWENNEWIGDWKNVSAYDHNGKITMWVSYVWENNGWVESGRKEFRNEYTYTNGKITMWVSYSWLDDEWQREWKNVFAYDDNGNLIMETGYRWIWSWDKWVEEWKLKFTFNNNGNKIMRIYYWWCWENNAWREISKNVFEYNDNGNRIIHISYSWANNAWVESRKYEDAFDNNGNFIMTISYDWENNTWIERWKVVIEYDLSVLFSNVVFPFFLSDEGFQLYNKPIGAREYRWVEDAWQESGVTTFYYSKLSTINIPSVPATSISIFPNPASYHFTISGITENTLVTISNLTGQIVLQQVVSPSESISVNHLPAGVYVVSVNGESQRLIVR